MKITVAMLPLLNFLLENDAELSEQVRQAFAKAATGLAQTAKEMAGTPVVLVTPPGPPEIPIPEPSGPGVTQAAGELLTWLRGRKATPGQIREAFPQYQPKTLSRALANMVKEGKIHWNEKRGQGSEYSGSKT